MMAFEMSNTVLQHERRVFNFAAAMVAMAATPAMAAMLATAKSQRSFVLHTFLIVGA